MLSEHHAASESDLAEEAIPAQKPSAAHHSQEESSQHGHVAQAEPDLAEGGSASGEAEKVHHTQKDGSEHSHTAQRGADPAEGAAAVGKAPQAHHSQEELAAERAHTPQLELDATSLETPMERARRADAAGREAALNPEGAALAHRTQELDAETQESPLDRAQRAAHMHNEGAQHSQTGMQPRGAPTKASTAHVVIEEHHHHKQASPLPERSPPGHACSICGMAGSLLHASPCSQAGGGEC